MRRLAGVRPHDLRPKDVRFFDGEAEQESFVVRLHRIASEPFPRGPHEEKEEGRRGGSCRWVVMGEREFVGRQCCDWDSPPCHVPRFKPLKSPALSHKPCGGPCTLSHNMLAASLESKQTVRPTIATGAQDSTRFLCMLVGFRHQSSS